MEAVRRSYRTHLRSAVATSAAPYGYTLTVWTSAAVQATAWHPHGVGGILFLAGAAAGFG